MPSSRLPLDYRGAVLCRGGGTGLLCLVGRSLRQSRERPISKSLPSGFAGFINKNNKLKIYYLLCVDNTLFATHVKSN